MSIKIGKEQLENIRAGYKKYLQKKYSDLVASTIGTYFSDTFFVLNNNVGVDFWESLEDEVTLLNAHKKIEKYLLEKTKRKNPIGDAKQYLRFMCNFKAFLDEMYPTLLTENPLLGIDENKKNTNNKNISKPEKLDILVINDLIDNVVRVKIGLRILLSVLEPIVKNGLKTEFRNDWWKKGVMESINIEQRRNCVKEKLDITLCFTLLMNEKYWERIFENKIDINYNSKKVNSSIKGLKVDRNINAHDLLEDICNEEAELTLKQISFLCNAFSADEASNKINKIIKTINYENSI